MTYYPDNKSPEEVFTWDKIKLALNAAEEGFYIWNIKEDIIHYTERCLTMMGADKTKEAPNVFKQPELIIHEEDLNYFKQVLRQYMEGYSISPMRIEVRIKKLNSKSWSWVRINGEAERDEHHKPTMLVGVWVNITRRKTAELKASEEKELFRTLIEHVPNSIYFKNRESRFVLANTATAKKLGVPTPSDLIGKTDAYFFDKDMSEISRRDELQIMKTGKPIQGKLHLETWLDKGESWSLISKFPWYSRHGELKGIVGISSDVTRLVKMEQEARRTAIVMEDRNKSLEKEIDLAREIQFALLPYSIPSKQYIADHSIKKLDFQHIFTPSEGVAGDWFDVFNVGHHGIGAIVCDVMGHGIRSALIASMLRGLMEQNLSLAQQPDKFLEALNYQLTKIIQRANITMFASAVYLYIDLKTGVCTAASAGHPNPIIKTREGSAYKAILPRGLAMGLLESAPYNSTTIPMKPGMRVLLYTDGLTEASNKEGEEIGDERIVEHLSATETSDTKEFVHQALSCVAKFTGCTNQADDICMLGITYAEIDTH